MEYEIQEPKYKLGQILIVKNKKQQIAQGKILAAECFYDKERRRDNKQGNWFYHIEINSDKDEMIYTYEEDSWDAKTKIIKALSTS